MNSMRIMGIDFGSIRIGIALSDPMQIIASPYKTITNNRNFPAELIRIIEEKNVGKIILGIPYNLEGKDSQKTTEVRKFARKLKNDVSIPVEFYDERFSSTEANEIIKKAGYSSREGRKVVDQIAASIILKNYLNSRL